MDVLMIIGDSRVGGVLSIIGVGLAIASYFWRRQKTLLRYMGVEVYLASAKKTDRLKDDLQIFLAGKLVPTVTSSVFTVWNAGNTLIRAQDVAAKDALRFEMPDGAEILQIHLLKASRPVNNVRFELDGASSRSASILNFDFLEANEGFVCEIIHTAPRNSIYFLGTIMNSPKSPEYMAYTLGPMKVRQRLLEKVLGGGMLSISFLLVVGQFFPAFRSDPQWLKDLAAAADNFWVAGAFAVLFFGLGLVMLFAREPRVPPALADHAGSGTAI